jgi:choline-sulfatase
MTNSQPNILFLLSDEHSFRFAGHRPQEAGGEPVRTPTLDRLAGQGTVFSDTYCQVALCTPSRMSLLSGREARRCGAFNNRSILDPTLPTIPKLLVAGGYTTCLVGKMHFKGNLQFHGFQHRPYGDLTGRAGHQRESLALRPAKKRQSGLLSKIWRRLNPPQRKAKDEADESDEAVARIRDNGVTMFPASKIQDEVVAQETVAFLREHQAARSGRPWFLCASFGRPHFPFTAPGRYIAAYPLDQITAPRAPAGGDAYDHPMSVGMRRRLELEQISLADTMQARQGYFACVSYLDEIIGDLLLRLEAAGLLDNTIIVYSSDHGELAGEHGVWWKQGWYEACSRVPLIISTPAQRQGQAPARWVPSPVGLYDLLPTFCGLAGVTPPGEVDGIDLAGVVLGQAEAPPDRPIVCDNLVPRWGQGTEFRMIRWQQYKYVHFRECEPLFFDLANDPAEQHNLAQTAGGAAQSALAYLQNLAASSIDFAAAAQERQESSQRLEAAYSLALAGSLGNQYLMPNGQLVEADDTLYRPTVLSEEPASLFADWPADTLEYEDGDSLAHGKP